MPGLEAALDRRARPRMIDRHEGRRLFDLRIVLEITRMRPKTRIGRSTAAGKLGITIPDDIMRKAQEVVTNGAP